MKKGAIELSINTLVVIILALVILGMGITFLYKLIGNATDLKTTLDARTQEELLHLLVDEGKQVALPFRQATIERSKNHIFGIGINNIGDKDQFHLEAKLLKVVKDKEDVTDEVSGTQTWLLYPKEPFELSENEHHTQGIAVIVPRDALPAQYTFEIRVFSSTGQYGNVQNIIVDVR